MITSDKREVAPEVELARLALVSTTVEESLRRRSTVTGARPSLGDIDGKAIQGPLPPAPAPHDSTADAEPLLHNGTAVRNNENIAIDVDLSSEGTLIDQPPATPEEDFMVIDPIEQAQAFEDKENLSPTKELAPSTASESHLQPLGETSPSRTNEQRPTSPTKAKSIEDGFRPAGSATQGPASGPPNRPPPIPPRHKSEDHLKVLKDEAEFAAQQQDVTEAISNVLFQLQCAINADGHDEATGEQVDLVKRLFFGKQKVTTTDKHGKSRTKEEYFSDIKVQMSGGPLDIYEALDTALDEQEVEVSTWKEPQHTTISTLPPILQIHVNRASYNKENNSSFKSVHHLTLEETIYLDRYLDSEDEELNKRRKDCWAWKRAVAKMEKRLATLKSTSVSRPYHF